MPRSRSVKLPSHRRRLSWIALSLVIASGIVAGFYLVAEVVGEDTPGNGSNPSRTLRVSATTDPVERGCSLSKKILLRMWRGYDATATEDVMLVPREPNFWGTFDRTSHTGPWDYLQTVPLVLYGPGRIRAQGEPLEAHANITDIYPTVGELLGVDLPSRPGNDVLSEALEQDANGTPQLVVVVMWDGVGRNVLERWPDRWPTLERLEREGTSYLDATVGSSPSITPATHSNLGTGTWPRNHGVVAIDYQTPGGRVVRPFVDGDPSSLKLTTFADEIDPLYKNASLVGMVAWQIQLPGESQENSQSWHQGMLGHGASVPGGDKDHIALLGHDGVATGNERFFDIPAYATDTQLLEEEADKEDLADGEADGKWFGSDLLATHDNPAWTRYQEQIVLRMLEREGYGSDETTDLFFTNFKVTDIVGHSSSIDSPRMGDALEAQDKALESIIDYLDNTVDDYVLVLSADHGHTPSPERTGAWPIDPFELEADVNARFEVAQGDTLMRNTSASGVFLKQSMLARLDVVAEDVAIFLNGYTIADNLGDTEAPDGYESRGDEQIVSAAMAREQFPDVIECAFGAARPPSGMDD